MSQYVTMIVSVKLIIIDLMEPLWGIIYDQYPNIYIYISRYLQYVIDKNIYYADICTDISYILVIQYTKWIQMVSELPL